MAIAVTTTVISSTFLGATSVQAATFTYNLINSSNLNLNSVTLPPISGAPSLTLTASKTNNNNNTTTIANVAVRSNGTGVQGNPAGVNIGRSNTVTEKLTLTFSENVILNNAVFARAGNNGNLDTNDGFGIMDNNGNPLLSVPTLNQNNLYNLAPSSIQGSVFSFFAPQNNDTYLLRSITVETIETMATVPESSPLVALLGLGGLGVILNRNHKKNYL